MSTETDALIDAMLAAHTFAVAGASRDTEKYGYKVFHDLTRAGKTTYPVNPHAADIDGVPCFPTLSVLPEVPDVVSIVTPPAITESVVRECAKLGIRNVWMQPGAESTAAVLFCHAHGIAVVAGGPCILVGLRTHHLL